MHGFWIIPIVYTKSQNYANMVVGEHGMKHSKFVVVVVLLLLLLFDVLSQ